MSYENQTYEDLSHEGLDTQTTTYGVDGGTLLPPGISAYIDHFYRPKISDLREKLKQKDEIIAKDRAVIADQQIECFDLKTENRALKKKVDQYESDLPDLVTDDFTYLIDPRLFKDVDKLWVKRQAKELDMNILRDKSEAFLQVAGEYKHYDINHIGLSLEDM